MANVALVEELDKALSSTESEVIKQIRRDLSISFRQLVKKINDSFDKYNSESYSSSDRKILLLKELKDSLDLLGDNDKNIQKLYETLLEKSLENGQKFGEKILADNLETVNTVALPIKALKAATEDALRYVKGANAEFIDIAGSLLNQSITEGWPAKKLARILETRLGVLANRADMIARTESLKAANSGALATYRENGIEMFQFVATADERTCSLCLSRNRNVYPSNINPPPIHPRCRCVIVAIKKEWLDPTSEIKAHNKQLGELEPDYTARGPFEKKAPEPLWTARDGWIK